MTTTTTAADRAETSRRNGAKSKGPKTPEGKERSKFNALKHGMTAKTIVLPGEDAEVLQLRIDTWTAQLQPRDDMERLLIQNAAAVSWKLDRVRRDEVVRLSALMNNAPAEDAHRQEAEVAVLGLRLLHDCHGSYDDAEDEPIPPTPPPRAFGSSALAADPDHPTTIVYELETTAAGCQWLLDQWAALRAVWDQGKTWEWPERFKALRLLGRRWVVADDPIVAAVFPLRWTFEIPWRQQANRGDATELDYDIILQRADNGLTPRARATRIFAN